VPGYFTVKLRGFGEARGRGNDREGEKEERCVRLGGRTSQQGRFAKAGRPGKRIKREGRPGTAAA
jgi:hypothetical protein